MKVENRIAPESEIVSSVKTENEDGLTRKRNYEWLLVSIPALLAIFLGLFWLATGIIILAFIAFLFRSLNFLRRSQIVLAFCLLSAVTVLSVLVRLFVIEVYNVPSSSMENALFPGDNILVSKLNYGPKLPQSPLDIPWVNLFFLLNNAKADSVYWDYKRLNGYSEVKRNDIVVFKGVENPDEFVVKRCIGLPGERISIRNSEVVVNNKVLSMPHTQKKRTRVWLKGLPGFLKFADTSGIVYGVQGDNLVKDINLTQQKKRELTTLNLTDSIQYVPVEGESFTGKGWGWSAAELGPILIPSKGLRIELNRRNFFIYRYVINHFEKALLWYNDGQFYLNGNPVSSYTFKYNYYFMIGDNWSYSRDSRFWGFLPEVNIVGKEVLTF